jgi:WD40 repeat protein
MFASKLKAIVVGLSLVGVLAVGTWGFVTDGSAEEPQQSKSESKPPTKPEGTAKGKGQPGRPSDIPAYKVISVTDERVASAVLAPNGKFVITVTLAPGNAESRVKKWDAESGELTNVIFEGGNHSYTVALSPSTRQLLVGDAFKKETEIHDISDLTNGPQLVRALANSSRSWSVAFAPDGKAVVVGVHDGSVQVYDAESGDQRWSKQAHDQPKPNIAGVCCVAFSSDGKWVVSCGTDKTVQLRDAGDGSLKKTLEGHTREVTAARFSPDGKLVASGGYDGTVRIWDAESGKMLRKIDIAGTSVRSLAFAPNGKALAIGGLKNVGKTVLGLWDVQTGKPRQVLSGHEGGAFAVAFSADGATVMAGGWEGGVALWRLKPAPGKK